MIMEPASQPAFSLGGGDKSFKFIKVDRTRMSYLADLPILQTPIYFAPKVKNIGNTLIL